MTSNSRTYLHDAIRFWEPRRIGYNLALTAVTVFWFALDWSHFRQGLDVQLLLALLGLGFLANVCYCAAYLIDIPLQYSRFRSRWIRRRRGLWIAGMLFAMLLASYWINDEIYPGIGACTKVPTAIGNRLLGRHRSRSVHLSFRAVRSHRRGRVEESAFPT